MFYSMVTIGWGIFKELKTIVDIRPAHEYAKSHIPGALSLPFPIDLKKLKKDYGRSCFELGVDQILYYVVDYKSYVNTLKSKGSYLGLYCLNGGLRSCLLSQILEYPVASIQLRCGMGNRKALSGNLRNIQFLEGGFNTYLGDFQGHFKINYPFIKICGLTGSGKTKVLREIHNLGGQILDLEQLTSHSGSAFGGISKGKQPDQWSFEQELVSVLKAYDLNRPVFVEEKGSGIGSLHIPSEIYRKIEQAPGIFLDILKSQRITNLVQNYGLLPRKALKNAIAQIGSRLGKASEQKAMSALKLDNLQECAAVLLNYYDHTSVYSQESNEKIRVTDINQAARTLMEKYSKYSHKI